MRFEDHEIIEYLTDTDTITEIVGAIANNDEHYDVREAEFKFLLSQAIAKPSSENNECLGVYFKSVCVAAAERSLAAQPQYHPEDDYEEALVMVAGDR